MVKRSVIIIFGLIVLIGCSQSTVTTQPAKSPANDKERYRLSIWLPEWEMKDAVQDFKASTGSFESVRIFGVYFNEKDEPFFTKKMGDMYDLINDVDSNEQSLILTFINDYVAEGQDPVQKDRSLIHRLLIDEQSREKHIHDIIDVADQFQVDGIEIDYEQIDKADLLNYTLFLEELYDALHQRGLSLHVVLEPSFPFETLLPDGPRYSVMAYNVHGYHSGPGPKTTFKFLDDLLKKLDQSNQAFDIAFATGGFTWSEDGQVQALTGEESEHIINTKDAVTKRDLNSDAIYFAYEENNISYEAWYADEITIQSWIEHILDREAIYDHFILWRGGGLGENTLDWINNHSF